MTTFNPLMSRFASPFGRGGYESTPITLMDYLAEVRGAPSPAVARAHAAAATHGKGSPEYDNAKKALPAVTPAALFDGRRRAEYAKSLTGIMPFDIDGLYDPAEYRAVWEQLTSLDNVVFAHTTPSGAGYRFGVRVDAPKASVGILVRAYPAAYKHVLSRIVSTGLPVDTVGGLGVSRLFFLAHDPHLYYNADAEPATTYWDLRDYGEGYPTNTEPLSAAERELLIAHLPGLAAAVNFRPDLRDAVMFRLDWLLGRAETNKWLREHWPDSSRCKGRGPSPRQDQSTAQVYSWLKEEAAFGINCAQLAAMDASRP